MQKWRRGRCAGDAGIWSPIAVIVVVLAVNAHLDTPSFHQDKVASHLEKRSPGRAQIWNLKRSRNISSFSNFHSSTNAKTHGTTASLQTIPSLTLSTLPKLQRVFSQWPFLKIYNFSNSFENFNKNTPTNHFSSTKSESRFTKTFPLTTNVPNETTNLNSNTLLISSPTHRKTISLTNLSETSSSIMFDLKEVSKSANQENDVSAELISNTSVKPIHPQVSPTTFTKINENATKNSLQKEYTSTMLYAKDTTKMKFKPSTDPSTIPHYFYKGNSFTATNSTDYFSLNTPFINEIEKDKNKSSKILIHIENNNTTSLFEVGSSRENDSINQQSKTFVLENKNKSIDRTKILQRSHPQQITPKSRNHFSHNMKPISDETLHNLLNTNFSPTSFIHNVTTNRVDVSKFLMQNNSEKFGKHVVTENVLYENSATSFTKKYLTDEMRTSVNSKINHSDNPNIKINSILRNSSKRKNGKPHNTEQKKKKNPKEKKKLLTNNSKNQTQKSITTFSELLTTDIVKNFNATQSERIDTSLLINMRTERLTREIHHSPDLTTIITNDTKNDSSSSVFENASITNQSDLSTFPSNDSFSENDTMESAKKYDSSSAIYINDSTINSEPSYLQSKELGGSSTTFITTEMANSSTVIGMTSSSSKETEIINSSSSQILTNETISENSSITPLISTASFENFSSTATSTVKRSTPDNCERNELNDFNSTSPFLSLNVTLEMNITQPICSGLNFNITWQSEGHFINNTTCSEIICQIQFESYYTSYNVCVSMSETNTICHIILSNAGNASEPIFEDHQSIYCFEYVNISFKPPEKCNGPITFYQYRKLLTSSWNNSTSNNTLIDISDLEQGKNYTFCIRAVNYVDNISPIFGMENCLNLTTESNFYDITEEKDTLIIIWKKTTNSTSFDFCEFWNVTVQASPQDNCMDVIRKNNSDNATKVVLNNIHAYTNYRIDINAWTNTGDMKNQTENYKTAKKAPEKPLNVTIEQNNTDSCTVRWTSSCSLTGPTTFHVFYNNTDDWHEINESQSNYSDHKLIHHSVTFHCLYANTTYQAKVTAKVDGILENSSEISSSITVNSPNLKIVSLDCNFNENEGKLSWILFANYTITEVENFKIIYNKSRYDESFKPNEIVAYNNDTCSTNKTCSSCSKILVDFPPENNFTVQVSVKLRGSTENVKSDKGNCSKKARPPKQPTKDKLEHFQKHVHENDDGTVSFILTSKFFLDNMGEIIKYKFYLFQDNSGYNESLPENVDKFWKDVYNAEKIQPYQVNNDEWNPFNEDFKDGCCNIHNKTNIMYTIGCNTSCSLYNSIPCNGPLRSDTHYKLIIRAFTRGGYTDAQPYKFYTKNNQKNVAIILTVCLAFIFLILSSAMILHYRRKDIKSLFRFCPPQNLDVHVGNSLPVPISNKSNIRPIPIEEFNKHFQTMIADSGLKFSKEFEELKSISPTHPTTAAQLLENRPKNRWINILPFDHSRVKLLPISDEASTDYINACYIPGNSSQREFIATQGPLPQTKDDFWRMVWEQSVQMIVMVTQCVERGKVKCEQYWPDDNEVTYYGDIAVQMRSESILPGFTIRIFDLHLSQANSSTSSTTEVDLPDSLSLLSNIDQGTRSLEVKQMHFTRWPDFGCPENTKDLINFVQAVREYAPRNLTSPIIVHCSAGVGRTGTFIAVDRIMQHLQHHSTVDVYGIVLEMRNYRAFMVQTEDQYIYIHSCVKDILEMRHPVVQELNDNIYENFPAVTNQDSQL